MTDRSGTAPGGQPQIGTRGERSTILHIGTMKSGTSFLQDVLHRNRVVLRRAGVRYLGRGTRAVWDVLDLRTDRDGHKGSWDQLVQAAAAAAEPTRLLSMEILSTADEEQVQSIVSSLGPDPVEVIITARDLARTVPSAWQNAIKHGGRPPFDEFVEAVMDPSEARPNGARFWRQHGLVRIVNRWSTAVGADKVHLVTLPPPRSSSDILWQRFCSVLGVDAGDYAIDPVRAGNESLSYSDAELLRHLNRRLGGELGRPGYNRYVRDFLAHEVMRTPVGEAAPDRSDRPVLDPTARRWASRRSQGMVRLLAETGVHVVGDLQDLVSDEPNLDEDAEPAGPAVLYPDTAVRAMAMLLRKLTELDPDTRATAPTPAAQQAKRLAKRRARKVGSKRVEP